MAESDFSYVNPAVAEIVVIRHGETAWNAEARIQGHLDVELNEAGRQQAVAVANRLAKERKISAVYSSDLKRALETAQIIATTCGIPEVIKDPDMRERNLGELQGLVYHEAIMTNPQAAAALKSRRTDQTIPGGGESLDQLYQRCTSSLQKIGNKHRGERVVVVTHGGTIRALFKRSHPRGIGGKILNTSVNIFHLSDGEEWKVKSWGDVSHLNQTDYLQSGFGGDKHSG
ncbi:phosphoglycerate mutase-like protein 4 [Cucurbita moschata]|uniref:Phosphoglycerate mutase-like protein 4 n=1 Tax=Cucurbita moschata TaxID=3662 RepID=A0A6J1G8J2_CUCMO|nr:phosphoglycerate mutase-like protein 4 [Cucurbita moschata]